MRKRKITIVFHTDAPDAAVEAVANDMCAQLDSLCDGSLDIGTQQQLDIVYATYTMVNVEILEDTKEVV